MKKFINWFYLCLAVFPFAFYVALAFGQNTANDILSIFNSFSFPPLASAIGNAFNTVNITIPVAACNICSWVAFVILSYLVTYLVMFLPVYIFEFITKESND